jgi:putative MFS transporter
MCGRAASIATPYATIWASEQFGVQGVLLAVIAVLAALRAAILTLGVETAKLSLDDNGALADGAEEALAARR